MYRDSYLQIPVFRDFTVEDLTRILEYSTESIYGPGQVIFRQGDEGRELFVIASGTVRFEYQTSDGLKRDLSRATFGMLFGEIAFLQPQTRTATAIAEEKTTLLVFQKLEIQKLIDLYPSLAATFYHALAFELAKRLRDAVPRIS